MNDDDSESSFDKVKKGFKKVIGGSAEVVEGTAQGIKHAVEDTKEGAEKTAKDAKEKTRVAADTDTDTYASSSEQTENRDYNKAGGNEPMNPEDIASHEPTSVKRDQDTGIAEEEQTGTDTAEAKEKFKKKGMTEV
jgi:hypothetical protein